jgi:outer membrane protein assembly factor BamB
VAYVGLPVVAGRYVYAVALTRTAYSTANLLLCGLDVMTGETLWQTTLGAVTEQGERFGGGRGKRDQPTKLDVEAFAELTEPAVARDVVVVSPNCGAVIAVGRFDGKVRWAHAYKAEDADGDARSPVTYRSTPAVCRDVVAAMPSDARALMALDLGSGRLLWANRDVCAGSYPPYAIAGASGDLVVLSGASLRAVDAGRTGKLIWDRAMQQGRPPRDQDRLTGPAVVVGQTVLAPTASGVIQVNVADGKEGPGYAAPSFRRFAATEGGRAAVEEAGATRSFGTAGR